MTYELFFFHFDKVHLHSPNIIDSVKFEKAIQII